jgi:glycosidase
VDGFRCDVASFVPLDFWEEARRAVGETRPGVIWLAEAVHAAFVAERRGAGLRAHSACELYRAFDLTYDYDIWPIWTAAVKGRVPVERYLEILRFQDSMYPANYVKMRCVENHDQSRIMTVAPSRARALAWTAFEAFNKGAFLIYAGQESGAVNSPSHFEKDTVQWGKYELQPFLTTLAGLKKDPAQVEGQFLLLSGNPAIQAAWYRPGGSLYGVFNTNAVAGSVEVRLPDGVYENILGGGSVRVSGGAMPVPDSAVVLRYDAEMDLTPLYADLLDTR